MVVVYPNYSIGTPEARNHLAGRGQLPEWAEAGMRAGAHWCLAAHALPERRQASRWAEGTQTKWVQLIIRLWQHNGTPAEHIIALYYHSQDIFLSTERTFSCPGYSFMELLYFAALFCTQNTIILQKETVLSEKCNYFQLFFSVIYRDFFLKLHGITHSLYQCT